MIKTISLVMTVLLSLLSAGQSISVVRPRCEQEVNPLGIDVAKPSFSWQLQSAKNNVLQKAYRVVVSVNPSFQTSGELVWDSKRVSSRSSLNVRYNGTALKPATKYYWRVMTWDNTGESSWSETQTFQTGLFADNDWKNAKWIAYDVLPDSSKIVPFAHGRGKKEWGVRKNTLPLIRTSFNVSKKVSSATALICGLGHFDMHLNGQKIGDHFLDPGWTQYSKHAMYVTFDITTSIQQGDNAIGVMLGNGFYYIPGERYRKLTGAYGYPKMIARILINYEDGSTEDIISNESWKTAPSPITFSSIYGGEDYDANLEQPGWNTADFDASRWKNAVITDGPAILQSQQTAAKIATEFLPVKESKLANNAMVYDLGQNFAGIPSIIARGSRGDTVRILPAELLNEDGSANQRGSGAPVIFNYILKGNDTEKWTPQFTYYGFRYLQVHYIPRDSNAKTGTVQVKGLQVMQSATQVGTFHCSSDLFNKTFDLIKWAINSNTMSVFTDCPHREKLGWLEQMHLMGSSVQYNYDIASLCRKVIGDMKMAQTSDGLIPEIAPEYVAFDEPFRDSPEWGSASIILPWYLYKWYGDQQTLETSYAMMKKYIGYLQTKANNHILKQGLGDWYDIGPNRPGLSQMTPAGVTATATFYYDLTIMYQIATILRKPKDAQLFLREASLVKKAFNDSFFNKTTFNYATGGQAANAMALYMNLVEPKYRGAVVDNLVRDVRSRNNALTAGDIGYRYVLRALEDAGRSDVIFDMNSRDDVPGYGYQLKNGATALTESWQALPSVSNNHFMLGHLMEWFYAGMGGIRQSKNSTAYREIEIRPQVVGNISNVSTSYVSAYGTIKVEWKKTQDTFNLQVTIPANTTAKVFLPPNKDIKSPINIGSGSYTYQVKL